MCPSYGTGILLGLRVIGDWADMASSLRGLVVGEGARQGQPREIVIWGEGVSRALGAHGALQLSSQRASGKASWRKTSLYHLPQVCTGSLQIR